MLGRVQCYPNDIKIPPPTPTPALSSLPDSPPRKGVVCECALEVEVLGSFLGSNPDRDLPILIIKAAEELGDGMQ